MISTLHILDFRKKLTDNTKEGNPYLASTPLIVFTAFNISNKENAVLLGRVSDSEFVLTNNSYFRPSAMIIKGTYSAYNETQTEVNYTIKINTFNKWVGWIVLPIIFIIITFLILIISDFSLTSFLMIGGIICLSLIVRSIAKLQVKKLETDFQSLLKVYTIKK